MPVQCHQTDCCTAVRIIENARTSWPAEDAAVLQHLIEMLAVLEWNSPSYCCTQVSRAALPLVKLAGFDVVQRYHFFL